MAEEANAKVEDCQKSITWLETQCKGKDSELHELSQTVNNL